MSDEGAGGQGPPSAGLVSTGLADLDVLLGDGVPRGYSILVVVPAGDLALRLTESFLLGGLTAGEGILLTLSTLSAEEFAARTARYNIDLGSLGDRARTIDWYSWRRERFTGLRDEGQVTKVSKDLVNVEVAVTRARRKLAKQARQRRAVFDILGPALADYERNEALDITRSLIAKMRADEFTSFWLLAGEGHGDKEVAVLGELFDGVVRIDGKGTDFLLRIVNLRSRPFSRESHALKMGMDGGIVVGLVPASRPEGAGAAGEAVPAGDPEADGISFSVKVTGGPPGPSAERPPSPEIKGEASATEPDPAGSRPAGGEVAPRQPRMDIEIDESEPQAREAAPGQLPPSPTPPPTVPKRLSAFPSRLPTPRSGRPPDQVEADEEHAPPRERAAERSPSPRADSRGMRSTTRSLTAPPLPVPSLPRVAARGPHRPSAGRAPRARPASRSSVPGAVTVVALVVVLTLAALVYLNPLGVARQVKLDGSFDDWASAVVVRGETGALRPGGIDLLEYAVRRDVDRMCVYARTSPPITAGSGGRVVFLLDRDDSASTGYSVRGQGTESSATLSAASGGVVGTLSSFRDADRTNWSAWAATGAFPVATDPDGKLEACLPPGTLSIAERAAVATLGESGADDASACVVAPDEACLVASLSPLGGRFTPGADAFQLELRAAGADARVTGISLRGPAVQPSAPVSVPKDSTVKIPVKVDARGIAPGDLVSLALDRGTVVADSAVTVGRASASSYFVSSPAVVTIDGVLDDWSGVAGVDLPTGNGPITADLKRIASAAGGGGEQAFLVQFRMEALRGSPVPSKHVAATGSGGGTVLPLPKVTAEDIVRVAVDSDNSSSTGHPVGGIGADWRLEVRGVGGAVTYRGLEKYDQAARRFSTVTGTPPLAEVSPGGLEMGAAKTTLGIAGGFRYVVEATDWTLAWDRAGGDALDPVVIRPDGTGRVGDLGSWSGIALPTLPEGRNWVDIAVLRDGIALVLRDDGEVWFTDGSAPTANWVRQTGPRPAGSGGVGWVGIEARRNDNEPSETYILRNDGLVLVANTGDSGSASVAWTAAAASAPPAGTAYVGIALSRQVAGLFTILRSDGAPFFFNGGVWNVASTSGLTAATDYASITSLRSTCGGGATSTSMVVLRASGEVRCIRDISDSGDTWIAYGTGGGGLPAAGSWVSVGDDSGSDNLYAMRNDGLVYRTSGGGPAGSWSVAGGTGMAVPGSTAYVGVASASANAAAANRAFVLRADGAVFRNADTSTNTDWEAFGTGTAVPAGGGAWVSVGARDPLGVFILASNGTVYRSVDMGGNWALFGDVDPDFSWVSVDVSNSHVYAMANDGWVERAPVGTGVFAPWNTGRTWGTADASWVSLAVSLDQGVAYTVRALRNDGTVEIAAQATGLWTGWGDADSVVGVFDSVAIACDGDLVYTVANDGAVSRTATTAPSWGTNAGAWMTTANASFVDVAATESTAGTVWILRNDGEVLRSSDSAATFPARGFLTGSKEAANAAYASLAAVPELSTVEVLVVGATPVTLLTLAGLPASRRRRVRHNMVESDITFPSSDERIK